MRKLNKIITTAAMVAAILAGTAPKAAATGCPYTVGPLGRYIAPAIVQGMTATDDGAVEVWCTDALDGDERRAFYAFPTWQDAAAALLG